MISSPRFLLSRARLHMTPRKDTEETGSQTSVSFVSALNTAGTETVYYTLYQSACQTSELPLTAHEDVNSHQSFTTVAGGLACLS